MAPRPAGLWRRAFAWVMDAGLLTVGVLILWWLSGWGFRMWLSRQVLDPEGTIYAHGLATLASMRFAVALLVPFAYFAFLESLPPQATLGKLLLGCRVARSDGARAGVVRVFWRTLMKPLALVPCGLGLLAVGFGPKRGLHDFLSGCAVVRRGG